MAFQKPKVLVTDEQIEAAGKRKEGPRRVLTISASTDSTIITDLSEVRDRPENAATRMALRNRAAELAPGHDTGHTEPGEVTQPLRRRAARTFGTIALNQTLKELEDRKKP